MGIRELLKKFITTEDSQLISWKVDSAEGIDFILDREVLANAEVKAQENLLFGMQLAYLKGLVEQSKAVRNANGFTIMSEHVVELGDDFVSLFELPSYYDGSYLAKFEGNTGQSSFSVNLDLILSDGSTVNRFSIYGPFLKLAENEMYSLPPSDWRALQALGAHQNLVPSMRNEFENNWLVFQLQLAKRSGMKIGLAHFDNLEIINPDSIGVSVDALENGDLLLSPSFGSNLHSDDIKSRLGQISSEDEHCILRVKNRFVLLDEKRLEAAKEILTNRTIPKEQVSSFLESPTAYLNAALIDLDTGFSLRVHGAERFSHRYFGDVEKSGIDWFSKEASSENNVKPLQAIIDTTEKLAELEERISDAKKTGAEQVEIEGQVIDISDEVTLEKTLASLRRDLENKDVLAQPKGVANEEVEESDRAVVAIDSNDDTVEFGHGLNGSKLNVDQQHFNLDNLKRMPYPHQEDGIKWMLSHLEEASLQQEASGALLADDMGLGKTYMTLVAISEWYRRCSSKAQTCRPVMVVAPLSLIENWQAEVDETFSKSPFRDIIVLQSGAELSRFKIKGAGRETQQTFEDTDLISDQNDIRYALKVGALYGDDRLDLPNRLVLTTYTTLRDYQFSLSRVDWGIVVFDEAQNLKNPNTIATIAAKGLKADFKLLATGTPVENSLKDFWCLFDTAVPGLLGAWKSFRETFITPILDASPEEIGLRRLEIGRQLRSLVGDYMLRRTKSEKLKDLPLKTIFTGDSDDLVGEFLPKLAGQMTGNQLSHYEQIISDVHRASAEDKQRVMLPSLRRLKVTSIHHDLDTKVPFSSDKKQMIKQAYASSKIKALVEIVTEIKSRNEKALIFVETKAVQAYVSALIGIIFKIPVEIINGETKAVPTTKDQQTRKGIIDEFQSKTGFGVIVMSPVAAGVGLTVVGANNVIHLERHWNPAKEAQATDRVYRIGQKKDVNVYIPMALHPAQKSFDLQLNSLLANKVDLSDAVVANKSVDTSDLSGCF